MDLQNLISCLDGGQPRRHDKGQPDRFRGRARTGASISDAVHALGDVADRPLPISGDRFSVDDRVQGYASAGAGTGPSGREDSSGKSAGSYRRLIGLLTAIGSVLLPAIALAGGGDPISQAANNAVTLGTALGGLACAGGVMGACAGGLMRNGGVLAAGATTAVCGGAWAGAPQVVQQVVGGAAGFGLSDLAGAVPASFLQLFF